MATRTLPQLQKQIAALQRKVDTLKKKESVGVIARIKQAIAHYGLTASDLGLGVDRGGRKAGASSVPAAKKASRGRRRSVGRIKYRDGAGNEWTGHGRRPRWFVDALAAGKTREDMAV